ncbi:MAG: hypothetical protein ACTHWQ_03020 [Sphingobacterium sp.]
MDEKEEDKKINAAEDVDHTKIPETVIKEKDDEPAGRNIQRTIIVAIIILAIFYLIYELVLKGQ